MRTVMALGLVAALGAGCGDNVSQTDGSTDSKESPDLAHDLAVRDLSMNDLSHPDLAPTVDLAMNDMVKPVDLAVVDFTVPPPPPDLTVPPPPPDLTVLPPPPDLTVEDLAMADLSVVDFAVPPDLSMPPPPPGDMASGPDLALPVDLTMPDMAVQLFKNQNSVDFMITGPGYLAAKDVDGDGKLDLLATSYNDSILAVALGKGDGTFGVPTQYPLTGGTVGVDGADLNGDGFLDVVVALQDSGQVAVLLGQVGGVLGAPTLITMGSAGGPGPVTLVDFDGDSKLDIAGTNFNDNQVDVLLGDGMGGFAAAVPFNVGGGAWWMAVADFNGDGLPDIVDADDFDGTISVLINTTAGGVLSFAASTPYGSGLAFGEQGIAAGDVDGDGFTDVVLNDIASVPDGQNDIFYGNALFTLDPPVVSATGKTPQGVAITNLNGDLWPDLITVAQGDNAIGVQLGSGARGFLPTVNFTTDGQPSAVIVADFNNDGKPDAATANAGGTTVSVFLNQW